MGPRHNGRVIAPGLYRGDRRHVVEEHLDGDPGFESGQTGAGAHVGATTEGQMAAWVRAIDPETTRVFEMRLVSVGRRHAKGDLVVRAQSLTIELDVDSAIPHKKPDGRVVPQGLFDGNRDELTVGAQLLEEVSIICQ